MRKSLKGLKSFDKSLQVNGAILPYRVEWRKVKYPRLEFKTGRLLVVLPESGEDEVSLLERKMDWILRKHEEIRRAIENVKAKGRKADGLLILGDFFDIRTPEDGSPRVDFENKLVECDLGDRRQLKLLTAILKEKLLQEVASDAEYYGKRFGVKFGRIFIKNQRTKWASCSAKKNLSFNFRLICLPRDLIKYVVCHEVLHLKEKRHNVTFWENIRSEFKDCKQMERSLFEYWFFTQKYSLGPIP
jgi:hypothetical protein